MDPARAEVTPERIVDTLQAYQRTEALRAAIELDLFSALAEGPMTLAPLAERLHVSPRGLRALLTFLASLGFVLADGDRFRAAPDAARFLDRHKASYLGDTVAFYNSAMFREAFLATADAVRRGGSDPARVDTMRADHPVWTEYARAMGPLFVGAADSLADLLLAESPRPSRILDVAAGHGLFGLALLRRCPEAIVTAIDWPSVLPAALGRAREEGVVDRFRTISGSAFVTPLEGPYDTVLVANFLHHFDAATNARLLAHIVAALEPGGRLAAVEFVPNDDRVTPPAAARFGLSMLTTTPSGDVYTFAELAQLLEEAGLENPRLCALARSPERAVIARRPLGGAGAPGRAGPL